MEYAGGGWAVMIAVDLFCGAGGLTRGLLNAGVNVVLGIDVNEDYRKTYEKNNSPAAFLARDVRNVTAAEIRKYLPTKSTKDLALVGCAPCQPFSSHQRGRASCNRNRLLLEFARLIAELKPAWVFMENVPGLAKVPGFSAYRRFTKTLKDEGYSFEPDTVDAKGFGVPQTRRRFILLAARKVAVSLPSPTHGNGGRPYKTVRQAISHLPPVAAGESKARIANHRAAEITEINLKRLKKTPPDGGGRLSWPEDLELQCHKDSDGHQDVYGRMKWDAPAPTLTCRCYSISNGRYGHPEQHRALSLREAALLQSFPRSYVFYGKSQRSIGEQIGNAVPVALAEAVGKHLVLLSADAEKSKKANKRKKSPTRKRVTHDRRS